MVWRSKTHTDPMFNKRAREYAASYGLGMTGGSDTHYTWGYPGGGIALDKPIEKPEDYLERLKNNDITEILVRGEKYMKPWPQYDFWKDAKRPDITLLEPELRERAEKFYASIKE